MEWFAELTVKDVINLAALLISPIAAVQVERFLSRRRDDKNKRENIFKSLMASRGATISYTHVEALNRIDLEFSNKKKYRRVIEAWKELFDHLSEKPHDDGQLQVWGAQIVELRANLLYEMGQALNYKFDKAAIKRNIYSPQGHERVERENELIREKMLRILNGEDVLPIQSITDDETAERAKIMQDLLTEYYKIKLNKLKTAQDGNANT